MKPPTERKGLEMTKLTEKQRWLQKFEDEVIRLIPGHAGKINWDAATHFFNQRESVTTAAERYVNNLDT